MRSRVLAELVALFAPPACAGCSAPLEDPREAVCAACRRALPWLRRPACARCGLPSPCRPCPAARAAFDRAWSAMAYAGPARALVTALKFDGALALADVMAAQMASAAPPDLVGRAGEERAREGAAREGRAREGPAREGTAAAAREGTAGEGPVLVPVPAHPAHVRRRGFDQADRLARALSARTGLPLAVCLARAGEATAQLGQTRTGRLRPGAIAIAATKPAPRTALLIDDVHTTGATLDAAARALRAAGATRVAALTYARTLRG